jgi:hypothetical protein
MTTIQAPEVVKAGLWDERMTELAAMRVVAYQTYVKSVDDAKWSLDWTLSLLDDQREPLASMRDDAAVLVRNTQGAAVTRYHSATHPCGRVTGQGRRLSSFDHNLEGEARKRHLSRCPACSWPSTASVSE